MRTNLSGTDRTIAWKEEAIDSPYEGLCSGTVLSQRPEVQIQLFLRSKMPSCCCNDKSFLLDIASQWYISDSTKSNMQISITSILSCFLGRANKKGSFLTSYFMEGQRLLHSFALGMKIFSNDNTRNWTRTPLFRFNNLALSFSIYMRKFDLRVQKKISK